MQSRNFVKAAMFVAAIAFVPAAAAFAHGSGPGMMQGQGPGMGPGSGSATGPGTGPGYGMMGPGMMGQGYGPGMMGPGMMGQGYGMMGPGMMNMMHGMMGSGMMGYGMGPGMMGQGYGRGMMGQGYGPGMMGAAGNREVTEEDVREFLGRHLEMRGLERLKVGSIDASDEKVLKADIVTREDSLVVRVVVDRRSGFPVAFE